MSPIGLIGAGHIGSQVARLAIASGHNVVISNSRGPGTLAGLVAELGPKARAATPAEAAEAGDIVVVTVPLKNVRDVPAAPLARWTGCAALAANLISAPTRRSCRPTAFLAFARSAGWE